MSRDGKPSPGTRDGFSVRDRIESFGHALRGIAQLLRSEHNAWIHALATLFAIVLGAVLEIGRLEWLAVALAIAMVWTAEALNTAIEAICDVVSPDHDPRIKTAKDAAAGAVLLSAIGAVAVGLIVFGPRVLLLFARISTR